MSLVCSAVMDGQYRYQLARQWKPGPWVLWVMLNPSTANESHDDATIRRCIGFTMRWGYYGLRVVNLFALRSTDPRGLLVAKDPTGPDNDLHIQKLVQDRNCRMRVVAWGDVPAALRGRERRVLELLGAPVWCLGKTAAGNPRHPVRLGYAATAITYTFQETPCRG